MKKITLNVAAGLALTGVILPLSLRGVVASQPQAAASHLYHVTIGVDTGWPALTVNTPVPSKLVIHAGDRVQFVNAVSNWPQTVTFGPIENTPALITDQQATEINPQVVKPQGGSVVGDVSQNVYSSGALMRGIKGLSTSYTFTFPRPGFYLYRSLFHPLATAEIDVVAANKSTSLDRVDTSGALLNALRSTAQALEDEQPQERNNGSGGDTITIGLGNRDISLNKFTPSGITVPVSTTLTWTINETSGDLHALVFNPHTAESVGSVRLYTGLTSDGGLQINPNYSRSNLVSGTTLSAATLDGMKSVTGGNWTSGIMYGSSPNSPSQVPTVYKLKFVLPQTYIYVDPFHPGMQGTINVVNTTR